MSTWVAFAVKGAAVVGTTSVGAGVTQAITPGALDGFAVGTLLTGMCFLVIVAPWTIRRSRLSARRSLWSASMRHARVRPDYYAAPADTHSLADAPDAPDATDEASALEPALSFADPALEVLAPAASRDHAGHAGADPYAADTFAPATCAAGTFAPATCAADTFAPAAYAAGPFGTPGIFTASETFSTDDPFGTDSDDDIVLPGDDEAQHQPGRGGYRSRHRMSGQENADRRPEAKRSRPRHAAPPARFRARMGSKLSSLPLVPARG